MAMKTQGPNPWPHQLDACRFIHTRRGTLLYMAMGTGKSRVIVDYIQNTLYKASKFPRALIFCPLAVAPVWPREFIKYHVPPVPVMVDLATGSIDERTERLKAAVKRQEDGEPLVAVINYDAVVPDLSQGKDRPTRKNPLPALLMKCGWSIIVLDECHRIKSASGAVSRFMSRLCRKSGKVVGLSGTPMSQGPQDIYAQMRAISPGLFGRTHQDFKDRYLKFGGYMNHKIVGYQNEDEFAEKLNTVTFRVGSDVLDLPEGLHDTRPVCLPPKAQDLYDQLEYDLFASWMCQTCGGVGFDPYANNGKGADCPDCAGTGFREISASNALVKLLRLQQLAGGFLVPDSGDKAQCMHTAKLDAICDLIGDLPIDEKAVVFCRFKPEIAALTLAIHKATGRTVFLLTGDKKQVNGWRIAPPSEGAVLLVQVATGSEGEDFTAARYQIYNSLSFSLKDYEQSQKRILRPGQKRSVYYYHIVAGGTVDDDIYKSLREKHDGVMNVVSKLIDRRRHNLVK